MYSTEEIIDSAPRVFDKTKQNGGWYIPTGWVNLVYALAEALEDLNTPPFCVQVKEKFGGLRFYVDWPEDADVTARYAGEAMIDFAQRLSYDTCQDCGAPGHLGVIRGWYYTLCPVCRAARDADNG